MSKILLLRIVDKERDVLNRLVTKLAEKAQPGAIILLEADEYCYLQDNATWIDCPFQTKEE